MNNERIRELVLDWPHVAETLNWGHHLVFWAGDRAVGGKMFALIDADGSGQTVLCLWVGPERFYDLIEREEIEPAAYLAKYHWVEVKSWRALSQLEFEELLRAAYERTLRKLTPRTQSILAMPERERNKVIRERRKLLAEREKKAKAAKAAKQAAKKAAAARAAANKAKPPRAKKQR